jgi:hypothetical protein
VFVCVVYLNGIYLSALNSIITVHLLHQLNKLSALNSIITVHLLHQLNKSKLRVLDHKSHCRDTQKENITDKGDRR